MGSWGMLAYLFLPVWAGLNPVALGLGPHAKGKDASARRLQHQLQHGSCTYMFLLPEVGGCDSPAAEYQVSNSLQRDASSLTEAKWPVKRLQQLENIMENNTQWLQKLENYIQENVRMETSEHLSAVQNHTAAMLEIGTTLLNQTAEQTRKLTDVEMQVLTQSSRLEIQVLENSLSTNKLEKQLLLQIHDISKLQERNSFLEKKVLAMEGKREEELQGLRSEKLEIQRLFSKQMDLVGHLEQRLSTALVNNTALQRQQASLAETVKNLMGLVSQCDHISLAHPEEQKTFKDCADAYKSGFSASGVYTLWFPNTTATAKVLCDMEISGGGWTVIQHRKDGSVDFQRTWKEYKQSSYSLRVRLQDWESNEAYACYEHFQVGPEDHNYRLYVRRYSGTAGRTSSLSPSGTNFSTKDIDNDRCACKCAQMAGGGWWFDACGPSNLNGIYYSPSPVMNRYNGMKWHYWKGPSHSLKMTTMMIRPVDFREE
ncbi:angiopoietin-2-like isoform X2 [Rhineura floridana]|uniref:angiopoietin-2-like isoform X2 n=1 Tax=Rhineura floridana TaxID=261503 RepID=UPI002AC85B34|nr:angiopoietin-2-like isoform X2 [Rhineura floridana]